MDCFPLLMHPLDVPGVPDNMGKIEVLEAALRTVQAEEREACAKVAESRIPDPHEPHEVCTDCWLSKDIATAIRTRSQDA